MLMPYPYFSPPKNRLYTVCGGKGSCNPIKFSPLFEGHPYQKVQLPNYPFQRQRFWLSQQRVPSTAPATAPATSAPFTKVCL